MLGQVWLMSAIAPRQTLPRLLYLFNGFRKPIAGDVRGRIENIQDAIPGDLLCGQKILRARFCIPPWVNVRQHAQDLLRGVARACVNPLPVRHGIFRPPPDGVQRAEDGEV